MCKLTRIAGIYMDGILAVQLEEASPPDCLTRTGEIWRFSYKILNALRSGDNLESETAAMGVASGPQSLITAKFKVNLRQQPAQFIYALNLSRTQNIKTPWAKNATVGPLESQGCIAIRDYSVSQQSHSTHVESSLQVVNDELVIGCRID